MANVRPLPDDITNEIQELHQETSAFLKVDLSASPKSIVEVINEFIRQTKAHPAELEEDCALGMGVLLGEQYVRQFNWHWGHVNFEDDGNEDHYAICVLPPDNSLAILPIWWVNNILTTLAPTNILLNFNMVAENKVPPASPGEAMGFH